MGATRAAIEVYNQRIQWKFLTAIAKTITECETRLCQIHVVHILLSLASRDSSNTFSRTNKSEAKSFCLSEKSTMSSEEDVMGLFYIYNFFPPRYLPFHNKSLK